MIAISWNGDPGSVAATLWDQGGPGLGLPPVVSEWVASIPPPLRARNTLMIMEPWTTDGVDSSCLEQLRSCPIARLRTSTSRSLSIIRQAERAEGWHVRSVYAVSFGAVRATGLLQQLSPDWIVLQTPAPPVGASMLNLARRRAQSITSELPSYCASNGCRRAVQGAFRELLTVGMPKVATGQEVAMGILAVTTRASDNRAYLQELVRSVAQGNAETRLVRQLKVAGRQFQGFDKYSISPRAVALWADICPAYVDWSELRDAENPMVAALGRVYSGCDEDAVPATPTYGSGQHKTLLVEGVNDLVVPIEFQRRWSTQFGSKVDSMKGNEHGWQSGETSNRIERWIHDAESG